MSATMATPTTTVNTPFEPTMDYMVEIHPAGDLILALSDTDRQDGSALEALREMNESSGCFCKNMDSECMEPHHPRVFEVCGSPQYKIDLAFERPQIESQFQQPAGHGTGSSWSWPAEAAEPSARYGKILVKVESKKFEKICRPFHLFIHPTSSCGYSLSKKKYAELEFPEDDASAMLALIVIGLTKETRQTESTFRKASKEFLVEFLFIVDKYCIQEEVGDVLRALHKHNTVAITSLLPEVEEQALFFKLAGNHERYLYALHQEVKRSKGPIDTEYLILSERDFRRMTSLRLYYLKELSLWYNRIESARCRRCVKNLGLKDLSNDHKMARKSCKGGLRLPEATARAVSILKCPPSSNDYAGISLQEAFDALEKLDDLQDDLLDNCKNCTGPRKDSGFQRFNATEIKRSLEYYRKWERCNEMIVENRPEPLKALEDSDEPLQKFGESWARVMEQREDGV